MMYVTDDVSGIHITPAHDYMTVINFENILDDINRGLIPTGTGQIFPVVWPSDFTDKENADANLYEFDKKWKEKMRNGNYERRTR
jgi:hypothetical protein